MGSDKCGMRIADCGVTTGILECGIRNAPTYANLLRQGSGGQEASVDRDCEMEKANSTMRR
jgi:hypothetical protein